jgi:hypothetical protein
MHLERLKGKRIYTVHLSMVKCRKLVLIDKRLQIGTSLIKRFHSLPSPRQKQNSLTHHFAQVSVYSVYITNQFQTTFVHGWGEGGGGDKIC